MTMGMPFIPVSTLYTARMDRDIEHRLANFLYQRGVPGGSCVRLDVQGGVVAVSGELPTRYAKWLCFECCRRVAGVIKVVDQMTVAPAICNLSEAAHVAAMPHGRVRNRLDTSDHRAAWRLLHIKASKHAMRGTVAA